MGLTTSLSGAGGFGKTTLAEMICASPRVRQRYKGGVYSFAIGREVRGRAEIAARVAEITRFITGDTEQFSDPTEAGRHLGRLLDQRERTLLFLDDVWTDEQLEPFLQGGTHCVRLITTRVRSLLPAGTRTILVDQMTLGQARAVLTWELDGLPPLTTGALLDTTGRWPLLLRLVNRQIKAQVETGQDLARAAEEMLHHLRVEGPQGVDPTGASIGMDRPEERRRAIRATVEAATDLLREGGMERFAELAIFAEDETVPVRLIARLWRATGGLSERASRDLCAQLAHLSLLTLTSDNGGRISLHDVIRDYLLGTHDPTRLAALHGHLVDVSADDLPDAAPPSPHTPAPYSAWWELADGYLQDHLIEHLVAAGRIELAEAVASDLRWVEDRLVRHGANAPQRDLSHVPTADAASRTRSLAQITHLLTPTDPAPLVVNTLYSQLAFVPSWRGLVTARLDDSLARPLLVGLWSPPDLPDHALLATLTGTTPVYSVAISPDGAWLATGNMDGEVRLWDRASGRCTKTLTGHTSPVMSLTISPDGTWLAAHHKREKTVRLWDRANGRCITTLTGHNDPVHSVAISPDGTWLATNSKDGEVRLWDRASGQCTKTLTGHTSQARSVAISPEGTWLAISSGDKTVQLWDRASGQCTKTLTGHTSQANRVAISPDGTWLATGGMDREVRLWDRASGRCITTLTGHNGAVFAVAVAPDGTWLAAGTSDGEVRLWDRASGQCTKTLTGTGAVHSVAISSDGAWLATHSGTGEVRLWDRASGQCTKTVARKSGRESSVAISPDGTWLAISSGDQKVQLWDPTNMTLSTDPQTSSTSSASILPDAARAASDSDETFPLRSAIGEWTATFAGQFGPMNLVAISPDGAWLATSSRDGAVRLWDRASGRCTTTLTGHTAPVISLAISPDGAWLATSSGDKTVRLWDRTNGQCTTTLTGHTAPVISLAISPDGAWLATSSGDKTVRLWDRTNGRCTTTLTGEFDRVTSVAISPDGAWLATSSRDGAVRLWDRASGQCTTTLTGHTDWASAVAISPDGTWLATRSMDGEVRLWDRASGQCTKILTGGSGPVTSVAISPDSTWLASVSMSGEIRVWNVRSRVIATLVRTDGSLTGCTWASHDWTFVAIGTRGLHLFELRT
ncbi:NB-ARC domain-containing protein (plasmid) [Streptomyces sp. NBC_01166]|uniref:NB-ARC domain-containing protein n=1 Tax=Streptomyces sp. NBC_01166 TaxID=2903755 RepID=UPI002F9094F2|nr:NB-ARC domain-containing protein [Streptomyces sp. NBC_01166]